MSFEHYIFLQTQQEIAFANEDDANHQLYIAQMNANVAGYISSRSSGTRTVDPRDNRTGNVTISMSDYDTNSAGNVKVVGTSGGDDFLNHGTGSDSVWGEGGNDILLNDAKNSFISGGAGDDYINNRTGRTNVTLLGGDGDDYIFNSGDNSSISGGAGNDSLENYADECLIMGGAGDDYINCTNHKDTYTYRHNEVTKTTINAGTGNDIIDFHGYDTGNVLQYKVGDGNDTVRNWHYLTYNAVSNLVVEHGNTLYVEGDSNPTQEVSGKDIIVKVGNGSITFKDAVINSVKEVNIVTVPSGTFRAISEPVAPRVTTSGGSSTSTTGGSSSTSTTGGSSSTSISGGSSTSTTSGGSSTSTTSGGRLSDNIYTGGNKTISNYNGQAITLGAYTGAAFQGNKFVVASSSGELVIENVTDKVIDLRDGAGREFLKAYTPSAAGIVDGRGINCYEIIYGSAGSDVIIAGDKGSKLWGGEDVAADYLFGGAGADYFFASKSQGADNFINVSSGDAIRIYDASLSDIVATAEFNGNIAIGFNTGNIITIQSTELLSAAINLADGTSWRFNHVNKSWQSA